jgi:hypothetical protein
MYICQPNKLVLVSYVRRHHLLFFWDVLYRFTFWFLAAAGDYLDQSHHLRKPAAEPNLDQLQCPEEIEGCFREF